MQSTPEKDTDVFTAKATLRNSQKLILQTSWNSDFLHKVIEGTKDRIPSMTDAVLKFINKYHVAHFGFDLNQGGIKLKNTVSNVIERAYHEVPLSFNTQLNSIKHLSDQGKDMSMSLQGVVDRLAHMIRKVLKISEDKIYVLLDAVTQLLSDIHLTLPESEEKLSSMEMVQRARRSVSRATDRAIQRFSGIVENISRYIKGIRFTIPGTDVIDGNEIMDNLMSSMKSVYDQFRNSVARGFDFFHKTVHDLFQVIAEKAEDLITYLKDKNIEIAYQLDAIYADVLQYSNQHTEEAKRYVAEYKDNAKLMIQEAHNALSIERVNNNTQEFISILQSNLYSGLNGSIPLTSSVSNKKMEIILPFLWKSFSEWPQYSQ